MYTMILIHVLYNNTNTCTQASVLLLDASRGMQVLSLSHSLSRVGTPDPNPRDLLDWCVQYNLVSITLCVYIYIYIYIKLSRSLSLSLSLSRS